MSQPAAAPSRPSALPPIAPTTDPLEVRWLEVAAKARAIVADATTAMRLSALQTVMNNRLLVTASQVRRARGLTTTSLLRTMAAAMAALV